MCLIFNKKKHPNYRKFVVDPNPPIAEAPKSKATKDYKRLLAQYQSQHDSPLPPVKHRSEVLAVPQNTICPIFGTPHSYLYYNDGKKRTQLRCKVCWDLFQLNQKTKKVKYFCPCCHYALFRWKARKEVTIHKCPNDNCSYRVCALKKLNDSERTIRKTKLSQFKVNYQYREYHFEQREIKHTSPETPKANLTRIQR